MAEGARIYSVDAVKHFRAALIKFAEGGNGALTAADGDIDRVLGWLERDQTMYWTGQVRKRHDIVVRCEDAVRQKKIFKSADGGTQSVVDEMKALQVAKRREDEANAKVVTVKRAIAALRKEAQMYKGRVQRLQTFLSADLPKAVHRLDKMMDDVAAYLAIQTQGEGINVNAAAASIAAAGGPAKVGPEKYRDRTPTPEQRQNATVVLPKADHAVFKPWAAAGLQDWQLKALAGLGIEPSHPDPEARIVFRPDVFEKSKIYLERLPPAFDDDSGWYLGPAEDAAPAEGTPPPEYHALRVGDAVQARADLRSLLSMPIGTLIVLDAGGPVAVLDGLGLDIWSIALIKAGDTAAAEPAAADGAAPVAASA